MILSGAGFATHGWLQDYPEHNPFAPLDLRDPRGWATTTKLAALSDDPLLCQDVLARSDVGFTVLAPSGEGQCLRDDRLTLDDMPFAPRFPEMTCSVAAGMQIWLENDVQPLAVSMLGARIARIEQLGTYNCRRQNGASTGRWSQHATGNAVDISGFVLSDGRRISVLSDWESGEIEAEFLRQLRDAACTSFGTVLSPDYNAAHSDHFHFDNGRPVNSGVCL